MQMPYKVEFFDGSYEFKGWSQVSTPELILDYLSLDVSKLTLPGSLHVQRGWYAHITQAGIQKWQGVVTAVSTTEQNTTASIKPLLSLFDTTVLTAANNDTSAEQYIADLITNTFISNTDTVEVIDGLEVVVNSNTANIQLAADEDTQEIQDVITSALEKAQIVVDCKFLPAKKKISVNIGKANSEVIKIDADAPGIISKSFSFRDDYGQVNKVIAYNKDDLTQIATFYADNYSPPTVRKVVSVSISGDDTFSKKAKEAADKELEGKDFDNCIELSFPSGYKLIPDISIGQEAEIYHEGVKHTSYLTGYEVAKDGTNTLIFGSVRLDLTKILKNGVKK